MLFSRRARLLIVSALGLFIVATLAVAGLAATAPAPSGRSATAQICLAQRPRVGQQVRMAKVRLDGTVYCSAGVLVPLSANWVTVR